MVPMQYSREHPSPRYERLLAQYRQLHAQGDARTGESPDRVFPGKSLPPQARHIRRLIERYGARTLLDYGSGKGTQYAPLPFTDVDGRSYPDIRSYWGGLEIRCYDPAYAPFAEAPSGRFDAVIATDVLEHVPEEDMPWVVAELFGHARHFVFANIACYAANRILPNGANAHCTVRPAKWWRRLVESTAKQRAGVHYEFRLQEGRTDPGKVLSDDPPVA